MTTPEILMIGVAGWFTIELISLPFTMRAYRKLRTELADAKRDATQWQNEANAKSNVATNAKAELAHYSKQLSDAEGQIYKQKVEMRGYVKLLHSIASVAHVDKNDCIHVRAKKTGRFAPVKFEVVEKE
jgi:hypothetical protein